MKKMFLTIMFGMILSMNAFAFDFNGVKSGMTEVEVKAALAAAEPQAIPPDNIKFIYNHEDKLYILEVWYETLYFSDFESIAFRKALVEKFGAELSEREDRYETVIATITDEAMYVDEMDFFVQKFINGL